MSIQSSFFKEEEYSDLIIIQNTKAFFFQFFFPFIWSLSQQHTLEAAPQTSDLR